MPLLKEYTLFRKLLVFEAKEIKLQKIAEKLKITIHKLPSINIFETSMKKNTLCLNPLHFEFVYFHQILFTIKANKINGYNKDKTMTKFERKKLYPLMMVEPKCTVA